VLNAYARFSLILFAEAASFFLSIEAERYQQTSAFAIFEAFCSCPFSMFDKREIL
jgi:hypothetical protein